MTTLPEEAVKAAIAAHNKYYDDLVIYPSEEPTPEGAFHAALKGALPFLPVQGAVKKLEWELVSGDHYAEGAGTHYNIYETKPGLWNSVTVKPRNVRLATNVGLDTAKAAAQADYEARVMSAIEPVVPVSRPSAARELALDVEFATIRAMIYCYEGDSAQAFEAQKALAKIDAAIRALSSPDHADAGKVEGDGWSMSPPKFHRYPYSVENISGEWCLRKHHGNGASHTISVHETAREARDAAPASEGAE